MHSVKEWRTLFDDCVHQLDMVWQAAACNALLLASWLFLECKTEAHKFHRGIKWYFHITNREPSAYTDKHGDFSYQDLLHSTCLRAMYPAVRLATPALAKRISFVCGHADLIGESNSMPMLLGKIQLSDLLYTCWMTVYLLNSLSFHLKDGGD